MNWMLTSISLARWCAGFSLQYQDGYVQRSSTNANRSAFAGLKKDKDRDNLITFMREACK